TAADMCGCGPAVPDLEPHRCKSHGREAAGLATVPADMCGCAPPAPDSSPTVASRHGREAAGLATAPGHARLRPTRAGVVPHRGKSSWPRSGRTCNGTRTCAAAVHARRTSSRTVTSRGRVSGRLATDTVRGEWHASTRPFWT